MSANLLNLVRTALIRELEELRDGVRETAKTLADQDLWAKPIEPGNSIGHLILHLTGNLNHFVGGQLGKTGYVRDREREFTENNHPGKEKVLANLDDAVATFRCVVENLTAEQLISPHPETRLGQVLPALTHLVAHFALHRGQMTYIARSIAKDS